MARIVGPLLSLDARGNWGRGALQFRGGLKRIHAYRPAPPATINQEPATEGQATVRAAYHTASAEWAELSEPDRASWNANAEPLGMSGWNLYLKTRLPEILSIPELPDPETYTPPTGDNILFPGITWVTDTDYTPPQGGNIVFPE